MFQLIVGNEIITVLGGGEDDLVATGMVVMFGGAAAPSGWLLCDGSEVSRTTYGDLFNVIGTIYGVGDDTTTFNLPDMRGRAPYGIGNDSVPTNLGENDGMQADVRSAVITTVDFNTQITPSQSFGVYVNQNRPGWIGLNFIIKT